MKLVDLKFQPGIDKQDTAYSAGDQRKYVDSNLVRFHYGKPERWNGWSYLPDPNKTIVGVVRDTHSWIGLDGTRYLALGTDRKLYLYSGSALYDITPIRETAALTNPFTTNGTTTVTVTDADHGAIKGDFVTFDSFSTIDGLDMNNEFEITTYVDANTYKVTHTDTASGSTSGGGGTGNANYQINTGEATSTYGYGWGTNTWSTGAWNEPSTSSNVTIFARNWSLDNFGEDLVFAVRNGGVYYWDSSTGTSTRGVALSDLTNANLPPTIVGSVLVSDIDRHVVCLGADPIEGSSRSGVLDPMLIAFSDQEDVTQWEPLSTNTAGSIRLSAGSAIIGGVRARQETLIWTDIALYSMTFIGQPFTFGVNLVNEGVGLVGPNAAINTPKGVFWMDKKGFYTYAGQVQNVPCSVQEYVFSDINDTQSFQIFAFLNKAFDEVGWFYCSAGQTEVNRYVVYNYAENVWSIGQLNRCAWLDEGVFDKPIAAYTSSNTSYLYNHETGYDADGIAMENVFIESNDFDIDPAGEVFSSVSRIIPDVNFIGDGSTGTDGQKLDFVIKKRDFPEEDLTTVTTASCFSNTSKLDTRLRARQVVLRVQSNDDNTAVTGMGFRLGATRLDVKPDGKR